MTPYGPNYFVCDWTTTASYDHLRGADRAALMWEWLRRDPGYCAWFVSASRATGGNPDPAFEWGLHFR